jgi:hypothetical protein
MRSHPVRHRRADRWANSFQFRVEAENRLRGSDSHNVLHIPQDYIGRKDDCIRKVRCKRWLSNLQAPSIMSRATMMGSQPHELRTIFRTNFCMSPSWPALSFPHKNQEQVLGQLRRSSTSLSSPCRKGSLGALTYRVRFGKSPSRMRY